MVWEKKEDEKMTNSEGLIYFHPSSDKIEENNYFLFSKNPPFPPLLNYQEKIKVGRSEGKADEPWNETLGSENLKTYC